MNWFFNAEILITLFFFAVFVAYFVYQYIKFKIVFFYNTRIKKLRYYKCERIPSFGDIPTRYVWRKNDDDALQCLWSDFIYDVTDSESRRIKPQ